MSEWEMATALSSPGDAELAGFVHGLWDDSHDPSLKVSDPSKYYRERTLPEPKAIAA